MNNLFSKILQKSVILCFLVLLSNFWGSVCVFYIIFN
jgi:hypothetical protein